ncbi:MAG: sulfotransferase domain-containing protein, partial [Thermodesulfobacteriota bacterium]
MNNNPLIVYFGHHKCASTWLTAIIREACYGVGWQFVQFHHEDKFDEYLATGLPPGLIERFPDSLCKAISFINRVSTNDNDRAFVAYTNAKMEYVKKLDNFKGFHVIRDPRDIMVSAYFSHLYSHPTHGDPEFERIRQELNNISKDEGLLLHMTHRWNKRLFEYLYNWDYSQPNVLEIKMEDMILAPEETLLKAFEFVGMLGEGRKSLPRSIPTALLTGINMINGRSRSLFPFHYNLGTISKDKL